MKGKRIQCLLAAVALLTALAVGPSVVLRKSRGQSIREFEGLALEAAPAKENYLPGELVAIKCRVVNRSTDYASLFRGSAASVTWRWR